MKALTYSAIVLFVVMLRGYVTPAMGAEDVDEPDSRDDVEYASFAPMMDFSHVKSKENDRLKEITKKSTDSKFVACESEEDCLRELQEAQSANDADKFQFVAEYVASPKRGMMLYKYPQQNGAAPAK